MEIVAAWAQFDIPFLIQAEDSIDEPDKAFQVRRDGIPAELRFRKQATESDNHGGKMFGLVEGERLGSISSTKVQVGFADPFLESLDDEYRVEYEDVVEGRTNLMTGSLDSIQGQVAANAVEWLNIFLERYRSTFGYYWIRRLNPSEIAHFSLTFVAEDGQEYTDGMMYARDGLTLGSTTMDSEQRATLQTRLTDEKPVPTTVALKMDAKDKIDLGEYRLAVLTAGTMFESFLKTSLREVMEAEGKSDEEIENAFRDGSGDYKGIVTLAKHSHRTFHFDFKGTEEYSSWYDTTRDLRNKVVHAGYEPTETEAQDALTAADDAVELLSEKIMERVEKFED